MRNSEFNIQHGSPGLSCWHLGVQGYPQLHKFKASLGYMNLTMSSVPSSEKWEQEQVSPWVSPWDLRCERQCLLLPGRWSSMLEGIPLTMGTDEDPS